MIRSSCPKCGREDVVADYLATLPLLCKSCGARMTPGDRIPDRPLVPPPPPPVVAPPPPVQAVPPPAPPKPPTVKPAKPPKPVVPKRGTTPAPAAPVVAAPVVEADTPDPQHAPGMNGQPRVEVPESIAVEPQLTPLVAPESEPELHAQPPLPQWAVRPAPPPGTPFPLPLASAGRRILARLLFLVGLVLMAGMGLAITVLGGKALSRDLTMQVMVVVTLPAIYLLANAAMLARTGQDVGKRYAGVKVVSDDGTPATPGAALLKRDALTLLLGLTGVGLLYWLADLVTLFTPGGRCLHDRIAKTRVVRA